MIILKEKNNESAENYLETILVLSKRLPVVRSVDVANQLDFKKSSVSIAMKNLREKNHMPDIFILQNLERQLRI